MGAGILVVLGVLLWRAWDLEHELQAAERERAIALAERMLARAVGSRGAFAATPEAVRAVVDGEGKVAIDEVAWLAPADEAIDRDLVVDDRLERATRAEFVVKDQDAAAREFDELTQAPLASQVRLRVLVAAAWQSKRAGLPDRRAALWREIDRRLPAVRPADLARAKVAATVASALRLLPEGEARPTWADALAPFLPPELFVGLPEPTPWLAAHRSLVERRELLLAMQRAWVSVPSRPATGFAELDRERFLWWQPHANGGSDVAVVTVPEWCSALSRASAEGALPQLPDAFVLQPAATTAGKIGPGVDGVVLREPLRVAAWARPAVLGAALLVLLGGFALVVVQQMRAARAEVAAVRTQSEFLTTVTHELKTPLAAIRLLGEMLLEGRARGREGEYYKMLAGEAGRLSLLIENVLDLGRLERGERAYDLRAIDFGEVVGETLAMFAPVAERDGVKVTWDDELGAATALLDRSAFVQALVAVLDNARKYGVAGGCIEVTTRRRASTFAVDVRDRGPGVPIGERDRIFDRFVRGAAHAHGSTPGVGIGLYLARSIARRLGGDLVCTEPLDAGPGACFTFTLPLPSSP